MAGFDDYERLVARIDAHAERVQRAHTSALACRSGCSGCCQRRLSVFPVEAARIAGWIDQEGLSQVGDGEAHVDPRTGVGESCALLGSDGRCRVYPVRPLICRTHGLPLAVPDGDGLRADVCPLNFEGGLGGVPSTDFLALAPVNTVLAAVNAAYVRETGAPDERVPLAELVP